LLCANAGVQAQTNLRQHEVVAGYPAPYFGYRYHFDDRWAMRISASFESYVDETTSFKPQHNRFMPRVGAQYYLTDTKIRPFVLSEFVIGFGKQYYTDDYYTDTNICSNTVGLGIGAGAEMLLWKRLAIAAYLQPIYAHTQQTVTKSTLDIINTQRLQGNSFIWDFKLSVGYRF
jgi:long-subunit fatty acid transport protein